MKNDDFLTFAALGVGAYFLWRKLVFQNPETIAGQVINLANSQVGVSEDAGQDLDKNGRIMAYMTDCGWNQQWGPAGWCMGFSGWCWNQALQNAGFKFDTNNGRFWDTCTPWVAQNAAQRWGIYSQEPQPGDMHFQALNGGTKASHTGIVTAVDGDTIWTVDGNYSNAVTATKQKRSAFVGFASIRKAVHSNRS